MCSFLLASSFIKPNKPNGSEIAQRMIENTKQIECMTYHMKKTERVRGKLIVQESVIKLNRSPFKVYIKQLFPKKGIEVLFIQNDNKNKAQINPNGFPWVNLNLHPLNSKMRKDQHHTIYETGFDYFVSILEHLFEKYGAQMDFMLQNNGLIKWNDRWCWDIEMTNPFFQYVPYKVKSKNETLLTIAKTFKISEYMILEHNQEIKNYNDIQPNQLINIPNDYTSKMKLLIDQKKMVPCLIITEDNKGLFEKYELTNLQINTPLNSNEFCLK